MLHSLKKKSAASTAGARNVHPTAEFAQLKSKLNLVKRNLQHADRKMIDADLLWKRQLAEQRSFAEDFCDGFVGSEGDDTHERMLEFASGATDRYDHFVRSKTKEDETFAKMHVQLGVYLAEIEAVEKRYAELVEAKSEVSRYSSKVDAIELKKKLNDLRKARNLQKMDAARDRYAELTKEIVTQQKNTYAKAAVCHKLALCSYWSAHAKHIDVLSKSLEKTAGWAASVEPDMLAIDVATLDLLDTSSDVSKSETAAMSEPGSPVPLKLQSPTAAATGTPVLAS
jgi:hypothetical protein